MLGVAPKWVLKARVERDEVLGSCLAAVARTAVSKDSGVSDGVSELASTPVLDDAAADVELLLAHWVPLLHFAVNAEDVESVRMLLTAGADGLERDVAGWSAYAVALFIGQRNLCGRAIADAVTARGIDVNAVCAAGGPLEALEPCDSVTVVSSPDLGPRSPVVTSRTLRTSPPSAPPVVHEHATLEAGMWELRLTFGGITRRRSDRRRPAQRWAPSLAESSEAHHLTEALTDGTWRCGGLCRRWFLGHEGDQVDALSPS